MADKKRTTSRPVARPATTPAGSKPANRVIAPPKKSKTPLIVGAGVVVLALIVLIIVLSSGNDKTATPATTLAPAATSTVVNTITSIPAATFDAVAKTPATSVFKKITNDPLTADGKPEVLYIGAEFCPFCAAQRWAMAAALSRFGTLSGIDLARSAPNDGDIATLTFRNATFTSQYLTFTPIENVDINKKLIKAPDAAQQKLWDAGGNGYPFIDVGGKYEISNTFDYNILAKFSQTEIAVLATDPTTPVGKAILSSANQFAATICSLTNNQPSNVCDSAGVKAEIALLPTK